MRKKRIQITLTCLVVLTVLSFKSSEEVVAKESKTTFLGNTKIELFGDEKIKYVEAKERAMNLLPTPQKINILNEFFEISSTTKIRGSNKAKKAVSFLQKQLQQTGNYQLKTTNSGKNNVLFFKNNSSIAKEGYFLNIDKYSILIEASSEAGYFYGVQTLLQLIDKKIWQETSTRKPVWTIVAVNIEDQPKHKWRSFMLDSAREYQSVSFIKNYLDYLAMLKMNVFHWHLTDGRGWRIEIKKYPRLTEVGASVAEGVSSGKFYTQEEIKEIIKYADDRGIMVVPEIDIPGHSEAALSAYPEYTCLGKTPESVMTFTSALFCGGNELTYTFLQDVFDEICELFSSKYIHIGGDEAPKKTWEICDHCQSKIKDQHLKNEHELQIYFTNRIAKYLNKKGRKAICWGDVVHHEGPKLEDNIVIQWWNWRGKKDKAFQESIKQGIPVICGTNYYNYLNFPVTPWTNYNENRTFDLRTTYEQNPSNLSEEIIQKAGNVLGMGTCLWTDWFVYENMIDKRVFPRIYSISEQMWHKGKADTFDTFYKKVKSQYPKLKVLGIDYGPALKEDIAPNFSWE